MSLSLALRALGVYRLGLLVWLETRPCLPCCPRNLHVVRAASFCLLKAFLVAAAFGKYMKVIIAIVLTRCCSFSVDHKVRNVPGVQGAKSSDSRSLSIALHTEHNEEELK